MATVAGVIVTGVPFYAIFQRRRNRMVAHEDRVEATCDAVLGQPPDPNEGRWVATPGMKDRLDQVIGSLGRIEASQKQLAETVERHIADDERQFRRLNGRVSTLEGRPGESRS